MDIVTVRQLYGDYSLYGGKELVLNGWIRNNRDQKSFGFISLNDGTCFKSVQVVYEKEFLDNFDQVAKFGVGSAVRVEGKLVLTPEAKQPFEIKAALLLLEGDSPPEYPIQPKRHSREFLREVAHLRPRTNLFAAVFRVRSLLAFAVHRFFQERGFVCLHAPIITANDAEGAGEIFRVTTLDPANPPFNENKTVDFGADFFGKKANLTVSGQLEAEAFALAFKDVYTFGPTFRAENSNTARHAAEFWMIEPEIAFADLTDNMNLAEDMVKYLINAVLEEAPDEMSFFSQFVDKGLQDRLQKILASDFARITYSEAVELLKKAKQSFEYPVEWGSDLQTEHERYLTEKVFDKPVFVTDYPKEIKAFYMRLNDDQNTVAAMDLLAPGVGEIIGGSQREERVEVLVARMADYNINPEELSWYLDLRRYGGVKHAGFGLGFERALMYLTGVTNIRDVIPFPRTVKSCEF
jgi:asparaginyl-tRNA synthetase